MLKHVTVPAVALLDYITKSAPLVENTATVSLQGEMFSFQEVDSMETAPCLQTHEGRWPGRVQARSPGVAAGALQSGPLSVAHPRPQGECPQSAQHSLIPLLEPALEPHSIHALHVLPHPNLCFE